MVRVVESIAEACGFEVMTLPGGAGCAAAFLEFRPDIVLLDMVMPEPDGISVLHELLTIEPQARVILVSGFEARFLRLGAGVAEFHGGARVSSLKKPFRREELVGALNAEFPLAVAAA
jgi:CheY-like chemotaxis protein